MRVLSSDPRLITIQAKIPKISLVVLGALISGRVFLILLYISYLYILVNPIGHGFISRNLHIGYRYHVPIFFVERKIVSLAVFY